MAAIPPDIPATLRERWGWAVAAGVAAAVLAVWMDLSSLHAHHTSDSFIPVLSGLYLWEPFFWKQNRFGSLVPLLSLWLDSPFANLLFQVGLRLLAVVSSFFLLARTVVPRLYWPAVGALTLALWIGAKDIKAHAFVQMQPYGQAIALSLAGIALLEGKGRWRALGGLVLLGLGFWVSATTLFWLFPLVWIRGWLKDGSFFPEGRTRLLLALLVAAFGLSMLFSWTWKYKATSFGAARPEVWLEAWGTLLSRSVDYLSPALAVAGVCLFFLAWRQFRLALSRPAFSAGLCLVVMAFADLGVMGLTHWAEVNSWSLRYVTVELLALGMLAPALLLVLLLEGRPARWQRTANVLMLVLLLGVAALRYGEPSVSRARASLDVYGKATDEIVASGATHLLGGYWRVWPAVFHANMVRWERGEKKPIWGITVRSVSTDRLWRPRDWSEARIAVLEGNERAAEDIRRAASIPSLYLAENLGDLRIYKSTPTGGPILASRSAP